MEYIENEEYILLNFKEQVNQNFFEKPELFFKIANLETKHPFVQIGNHVFRGSIDEETLGTSLLFEEEPELLPQSIYEKETNISLKYLTKTCKFLSLQWFKVPEEAPIIDPSEMVELEFKHSYETILKQVEDGSLNIDDIIKKPEPEPPSDSLSKLAVVLTPQEKPSDQLAKPVDEVELKSSEIEIKNPPPIEECYQVLKDMIQPQVNDPQYYDMIIDNEFRNEKQFFILKEMYLKSLNYDKIVKKVSDHISDYVDLQKSINDGIIDVKETLHEEDKRKLFSMENFDNFSDSLKVLVLKEYLKEEKSAMLKKTEVELAEVDEFGWTCKKRYNMFKSLVKDLKYNLFANSMNR